jgi:cell division protein ZapA
VKTIEVQIYDQTYQLRGDLDEEYVARLGTFVDRKMRAAAGKARTVDSQRAAVLAAVNIADELFAAQERIARLESELGPRAQRCLELVEQALRDSA